MKRINFLLSILVVVALVATSSCKSTKSASSSSSLNTLSAKEKAEGWTLLFDGKTNTGWRGYNKTAFPTGWEVKDGLLHCIGSGNGEAGNGGDVIYDKKFKDFELALEWKISQGGNSGIFILAQEIPGEPIWKSSPEMQILDNERHPDAKLGTNGNRMAGSLYDLIPAKPQNTKPAGEWNKVRILVYQGTVVYYQNDAKVLEYHLWTDDWKKMIADSKFAGWENFINAGGPEKKGFIGLQDHGNDVWFRNIKIKTM